MYRKPLIALAMLAMFVTPTLAATKFYLAMDPATKKCQVVDTKPDGKAMMMVGKKSFKTSAAADKAMAANKKCPQG